MGTSEYLAKGNVHLDMELTATLPYHEVIASLVLDHSNDESKILDIGCGLGHIESEIFKANKNIKVDIADAYDGCLEATQSRGNVSESYKVDEIAFNIADLVDKSYDIVVMSHVLEHLMFPAQALDEVMDLINPGGYLIVAVPNPVRPTVLLTNIFKMHYVNRGHIHAWDRSHWKNFLETIMGFTVKEYRTDFIQIPFSARVGIFRTIGKIMVKLVPWWGFSNIAVIKKEEITDSPYQTWKNRRPS